jgi:hypothetical protein
MIDLSTSGGALSADALRYHGLGGRLPDSPLKYDPDGDQCGAQCGPERAGIIWYGDPVFMCPRCFERILGGAPSSDQMVAA